METVPIRELLEVHRQESLRSIAEVRTAVNEAETRILAQLETMQADTKEHVKEYYGHLLSPHAGAVTRTEMYGALLTVAGLGVAATQLLL